MAPEAPATTCEPTLSFLPYVYSAFGQYHRVVVGHPNPPRHWITSCGWHFGTSSTAEGSESLPCCYKLYCTAALRRRGGWPRRLRKARFRGLAWFQANLVTSGTWLLRTQPWSFRVASSKINKTTVHIVMFLFVLISLIYTWSFLLTPVGVSTKAVGWGRSANMKGCAA